LDRSLRARRPRAARGLSAPPLFVHCRMLFVIDSPCEPPACVQRRPTPPPRRVRERPARSALQLGDPFGILRQARQELLGEVEALVVGQRERVLEQLASAFGHETIVETGTKARQDAGTAFDPVTPRSS